MKANFPSVAVFAGSLALALPSAFAAQPGRPPVLAVGDSVFTTRSTSVWVNPPTRGTFAGTQAPGSTGRIVAGPIRTADMRWWRVDFATDADGWASQRDLAKVGGEAASVPAPESTPEDGAATGPLAVTFTGAPPDGATVSTPRITIRGRVTHDVFASGRIVATLNGKRLVLDPTGRFEARVPLTPGANTLTLTATTPNPRQQTTEITSYLDGSVVYGSDAARAAALRAFTGGRLKTSAGDLLPFNTEGLDNANDAHVVPDSELFLAGDRRANENIELTSIQTLFLREHNQLADALAAARPDLTDEQLYQRARRLVIAEIQAITYNEFLPALLGPHALRPYAGFNPDVNAGIATEFSTAAYRIGHTLVNDDIDFLDNDGEEIRDGLPLAEAFFNPAPVEESGPDPILKYLATDDAQEVDPQLVDGLRNFLFGPPGAGGLDLASMNIQRGRDHGLPDYNTVRVAYGLPAVTTFAQISRDAILQAKLTSLYGTVDTIDLWVGGLAEDHVPGSSVGPTFRAIIARQFERTRDGDPNWFERTFHGPTLIALRATRLSDVIRRNTTITKLQDNVFFYDPDTTLAGLTDKAGSLPPVLVGGPAPDGPAPTVDGSGNNPRHPAWGAAGGDLLRIAPAAYADGISDPAGTDRPSPRLVSNAVCTHTTTLSNDRNMSSWVYGWGQFIDHDLDLTNTGDTPFDIAVPAGDPSFDPTNTGTATIPLSRSLYDATTGTATPAVAEKTREITYTPAASRNEAAPPKATHRHHKHPRKAARNRFTF
jgi:hypothetical protein